MKKVNKKLACWIYDVLSLKYSDILPSSLEWQHLAQYIFISDDGHMKQMIMTIHANKILSYLIVLLNTIDQLLFIYKDSDICLTYKRPYSSPPFTDHHGDGQ